MINVLSYHVNDLGEILRVVNTYALVENDLVHPDLIDSALDVIGGEDSGPDHLWVLSFETAVPEGFSLDESITDDDYDNYLQAVLSAREQELAVAQQAQEDYLSDLASRKDALATKLGLTEQEVDMLVIK